MDADRAGCEWAKLLRSPEGSESYPFGVMSDVGADAPADILSKKPAQGADPAEEPDDPASKEAQEQALRAAAANVIAGPPGPSASRAGSGIRTPVSHSDSFVKKEDLRKQMTSLEGELLASRQMAEKQQAAMADLEKRLLARDAEFAGLQLGADQLTARNQELEAQIAAKKAAASASPSTPGSVGGF